MNNTRTAKPGTPLRQERFASSYQSGLLANLVAKRCAQIEDASERAAIWFLQWLSWQPGGLAAHVKDIFPADCLKLNPVNELEKELFETCLSSELQPHNDPEWKLAAAYRQRWIQNHSGGVETIIGARMAKAFDYARETRCLVLVDGLARIGKTFSARAYCELSAGLARYVQVPYSNDDTTFFRTIGRALGVSTSLQLKATEIRTRVEDVLQRGDLALIFDEAAWLFPQTGRHYSLPARVNWLTTALLNFGVPVVLIVTEQFHISQKRVETQTGWASDQFTGRTGHVERLPEVLPMSDLIAVAGAVFPEGDAKSWRALAAYADLSKTRLAAIEALANRARWHARQSGRAAATPADLSRAIQESILPGDPRIKPIAATPRQNRSARATLSPARRDPGAEADRIGNRLISTRPGASAPDLVAQ